MLNVFKDCLDEISKLANVTFLVTGASGFLGSNVVSDLSDMGLHVIATDRRRPTALKTRSRNLGSFKFEMCNLQNRQEVERLAKKIVKPVIFVHLASPNTELTTSAHYGGRQEFSSFSMQALTEVEIAENLLSVFGDRIEHFIYTSSIDVFGTKLPSETLVNEATIPCPESPYGFGKLLSENLFMINLEDLGVSKSILRLPQIYGDFEGEYYERAIPIFLAAAKTDKPITLTGNKKETRQYLHCSDISRAIIKSAGMRFDGLLQLAGRKVSLQELLDTIEHISGKRLLVVDSDGKRNQRRYRCEYDASRATRVLSYSPLVSLESGLSSAYQKLAF